MRVSPSKGLVLVGTLFVLGATVIAASAATGHPRSFDNAAKSSEVTRTISITPSGGSGSSSTNLSFTGLLPGSPQSVTLDYQNTGSRAEDVFVVFPNATSLSALNSLAKYAQVHLSSNGAGARGDVFDSSNLNDNVTRCGTFSPSGCWPLRRQYEIARDLEPSKKGTFSFGFGFSSAYSVQPPAGTSAYWNSYPVAGQTTVVPSDGAGAGLPYELIATQPGITPGQVGTITQIDPSGAHRRVFETGSHFGDQLAVTGANGPVSFVVTSPNSHLLVSTSGAVTTLGGPLAVGSYVVSGTDSDTSGGAGTWSYTLVVTSSPISCDGGDRANVKGSSSGHFDDRLRDCDSWATPHYVTTRSDTHLHVSDDGVVTTLGGPLAPGNYTVSGTEHDAFGDEGTWSYTMTVSR